MKKKYIIYWALFLFIEFSVWASVSIFAGPTAGILTAYILSVGNLLLATYFIYKTLK